MAAWPEPVESLSSFTLAAGWTWIASEVSSRWYYTINLVLHNTVVNIDNQPRV